MSSRISADHIRLKRAYEPPASDDGIRIPIDRLWPRGVKKTDAAIDEWMKEIAPSTKLRKWFSHDPERWQEFRRHANLVMSYVRSRSRSFSTTASLCASSCAENTSVIRPRCASVRSRSNSSG